MNRKTQKQEQHIEILEKSQQLKFRMPTEIRISKHNALYQASIQLEGLDYTKLYRAYSGIRKSQIFNHTSLCEFYQSKLLHCLTIHFKEKPKTIAVFNNTAESTLTFEKK